MRRLIPLAALVLLLAGCLGAPAATLPTVSLRPPTPPPADHEPIRFVALGDTYTIGYGLPRQADRWPNQLVRALRSTLPIRLVDNLAVQVHSTTEVIDEQLPVLAELAPVDLVSLLVGINDVIGGATDEEYRANLQVILDGRERADGLRAVPGILDVVPPGRVVLITTPDYTRSPNQPFHRPGDSETIARFNDILREEAAARGIAVVDISPISDLVSADPTLVVEDGLRPSAKQYAGWVELIAPTVGRLLSDAAASPGSSLSPGSSPWPGSSPSPAP